MLLSNKYPFLTNFFQNAIVNNENKNKLTHSILFYGGDTTSQYILATEIARLLNCTGDKSDDCQCLNCKWIREGKHPAVLTFSRFDNKPEDDTTTTVISVKQAEYIRNSLLTASDFHRVFIFCDRDEEEGEIKGLNGMNFQKETANSLLKSIEEPPENVTFIFITRNKEDMISTIISRSQCFFVPDENVESRSFEQVHSLINNYWDISRELVFDVSEKLFELTKEYSPIILLEQIQNYMLYVLKENHKQRFLIDDIHLVEISKKEIIKGMKPDVVFDELFLNIIH